MPASTSLNEQGDEFTKLISLGVKILPLIVYKLCSETEAKAVKLCEQLPTREYWPSCGTSEGLTRLSTRQRH
jgi:hypothetical protein